MDEGYVQAFMILVVYEHACLQPPNQKMLFISKETEERHKRWGSLVIPSNLNQGACTVPLSVPEHAEVTIFGI